MTTVLWDPAWSSHCDCSVIEVYSWKVVYFLASGGVSRLRCGVALACSPDHVFASSRAHLVGYSGVDCHGNISTSEINAMLCHC